MYCYFYKEHHGHKEDKLQKIKIQIKTKKHEIAVRSKKFQDVTFENVINDVRDNVGTNLKREDLIMQAYII